MTKNNDARDWDEQREEYDIPAVDLATGELARWTVGVCEIHAETEQGETVPGGMRIWPTRLTVYGENGRAIARCEWGPEDGLPDLQKVRARFGWAIKKEMDAL